MNYTDWQKMHINTDNLSLVIFAEKMLEHSGLLQLKEFSNNSGTKLICLVSATHIKCAELLKSFDFIEYAIIVDENELEDFLKNHNFTNILLGKEQEKCTRYIPLLSGNHKNISYYYKAKSSYINLLNDDVAPFVNKLFKKFSFSDIAASIEAFKDLKILVIGETIIDEYIFTLAMNKSNKEPIIASQFLYKEKYAGGVLAVANHISNFCDNVKLITRLGDKDSYHDFINSKINNNIQTTFLIRDDSPTIRKQRIIESHLARKMYEVYFINNKPVSEADNKKLEVEIQKQINDVDLVVVMDYGHGLFSDKAIETIENNAKFLAVNTQTNAGNKGFNLISKYKNPDFIAIDCPEAQLECRNKEVPLEDLIYQIARNTNCPRVTITKGKEGNLYLYNGELKTVPMLSVKAIDTTGAGDAFFSLSSCAAACNIDPDLTGFIGNIAGAEACMIIGNKESITKKGMLEHIRNIAELAGVEYA